MSKTRSGTPYEQPLPNTKNRRCPELTRSAGGDSTAMGPSDIKQGDADGTGDVVIRTGDESTDNLDKGNEAHDS